LLAQSIRVFVFSKVDEPVPRNENGNLRVGDHAHKQFLHVELGLVFKAHRLVYHSTLGLRVIKKKTHVELQHGYEKIKDFRL